MHSNKTTPAQWVNSLTRHLNSLYPIAMRQVKLRIIYTLFSRMLRAAGRHTV